MQLYSKITLKYGHLFEFTCSAFPFIFKIFFCRIQIYIYSSYIGNSHIMTRDPDAVLQN
jgi:hypothetical protein